LLLVIVISSGYEDGNVTGNMGAPAHAVLGVRWSLPWISIGIVMKLRFDEFVLETGARRLMHGEASVHLTPKAFELLAALVEKRPNALSKAELHDLLWPATFVVESNLATLVNEVRRALGDSAEEPRFVRTVPRFGYAFCGEVVADPAALTTQPGGASCWLILDSKRIELAQGENLVGRDPRAEAWIDLPTVSRRHARIMIAAGAARLEDLGSKNGTCLRGKRVEAPEVLRDRDPILFGSVQVTFRACLAREEAETRTAEPR
jgi:DNA-binding winged helix-turn-helix (wHTH) protein